MELRQLEAFGVLAEELHFGRAAARLGIGQPTLSDLVRRLERELGVALLVRTTRRVSLTEAGRVLLDRGRTITGLVAETRVAVSALGTGEEGLVRFGFTPPAAPVLAPHLAAGFAADAPGVRVEQARLWLPRLREAVADGSVDVGVTCGVQEPTAGLRTEVFAGEPLLVALRPDHRLARQPSVDLEELAQDRLGVTDPSLFPAWTAAQLQALTTAGIAPPTVPLARTDLNAVGWLDQSDVDWVLLSPSLTGGHGTDVVLPVRPAQHVTFVVLWRSAPSPSPAVSRFVRHVLRAPLPRGWSRVRRSLDGEGPSLR
ncbi:LysR family transcriptional regulator [Microlunatus flavus]|uniref:LysR family transcriptional regulator n=1 Tax=Microlunatus flavus TaxID=1036181 RepID=UPI0018E0930A|nr:LysR family transcriptional regulator [Microlunatus flavus]